MYESRSKAQMSAADFLRLSVISFALAVSAGCGGRSVSGILNNNRPDAGQAMDSSWLPEAGPVPDGTLPDAGPCDTDDRWILNMVPLDSIEVLNPMWGGDGIPQGVAVRIRARVSVFGCDEIAGVQAAISESDRTVILFGYVWTYDGSRSCPHDARIEEEYFAFVDLDPGSWHVADYLVNSPGLPFLVRSCSPGEDCFCQSSPVTPGGFWSPCAFD